MESRSTLTENEQRLRSVRKVNVHNRLGENIRKIGVTYPNHENAFIFFDQVIIRYSNFIYNFIYYNLRIILNICEFNYKIIYEIYI